MSASLTNLQRDMKWVQEIGAFSAPASSALSADALVQTDGTIFTNHGFVDIGFQNLSGTAGQYTHFGLKMQWYPGEGPFAFRIKACSNQETFWQVGWSTSGANAPTIAKGTVIFLGCGMVLDDIFCIRERSAHTTENMVLYGAVPADGGNTCLNISCQNLLGKPDQYSSQVF